MPAHPKKDWNVFELCAFANEQLKAVGFERVVVSMKTEAVYFRFPGRHGVLRVAAHKNKRTVIGLDNIVARLTFHGNKFNARNTIKCSKEKIDTMIQIAVGQYMLRSAVEQPKAYHGKRGTWENDNARLKP